MLVDDEQICSSEQVRQFCPRDKRQKTNIFQVISLRLRDSRFARYLRDCCVIAGFTPRILHEVVESYSLTSLVAAGLGLALVPECVRTLARPDIVYRPLEPPVPEADVSMLYRPDRPAALDHLLELARAHLPQAA